MFRKLLFIIILKVFTTQSDACVSLLINTSEINTILKSFECKSSQIYFEYSEGENILMECSKNDSSTSTYSYFEFDGRIEWRENSIVKNITFSETQNNTIVECGSRKFRNDSFPNQQIDLGRIQVIFRMKIANTSNILSNLTTNATGSSTIDLMSSLATTLDTSSSNVTTTENSIINLIDRLFTTVNTVSKISHTPYTETSTLSIHLDTSVDLTSTNNLFVSLPRTPSTMVDEYRYSISNNLSDTSMTIFSERTDLSSKLVTIPYETTTTSLSKVSYKTARVQSPVNFTTIVPLVTSNSSTINVTSIVSTKSNSSTVSAHSVSDKTLNRNIDNESVMLSVGAGDFLPTTIHEEETYAVKSTTTQRSDTTHFTTFTTSSIETFYSTIKSNLSESLATNSSFDLTPSLNITSPSTFSAKTSTSLEEETTLPTSAVSLTQPSNILLNKIKYSNTKYRLSDLLTTSPTFVNSNLTTSLLPTTATVEEELQPDLTSTTSNLNFETTSMNMNFPMTLSPISTMTSHELTTEPITTIEKPLLPVMTTQTDKKSSTPLFTDSTLFSNIKSIREIEKQLPKTVLDTMQITSPDTLISELISTAENQTSALDTTSISSPNIITNFTISSAKVSNMMLTANSQNSIEEQSSTTSQTPLIPVADFTPLVILTLPFTAKNILPSESARTTLNPNYVATSLNVNSPMTLTPISYEPTTETMTTINKSLQPIMTTQADKKSSTPSIADTTLFSNIKSTKEIEILTNFTINATILSNIPLSINVSHDYATTQEETSNSISFMTTGTTIRTKAEQPSSVPLKFSSTDVTTLAIENPSQPIIHPKFSATDVPALITTLTIEDPSQPTVYPKFLSTNAPTPSSTFTSFVVPTLPDISDSTITSLPATTLASTPANLLSTTTDITNLPKLITLKRTDIKKVVSPGSANITKPVVVSGSSKNKLPDLMALLVVFVLMFIVLACSFVAIYRMVKQNTHKRVSSNDDVDPEIPPFPAQWQDDYVIFENGSDNNSFVTTGREEFQDELYTKPLPKTQRVKNKDESMYANLNVSNGSQNEELQMETMYINTSPKTQRQNNRDWIYSNQVTSINEPPKEVYAQIKPKRHRKQPIYANTPNHMEFVHCENSQPKERPA